MKIANELHAKIRNLNDAICSKLVERDEFVKGCMLAILSRKNLFVLGTPGTAKSYAVELICRAILGLIYFEYLLGAFTKPEELFGPYDIPKLKQGEYVRITTDRLPECNIGFLDETWKGNSSILNDLLRISDETRRFYNPKPITTPVMSLFGASNELPQDDVLNALYDRFQLRFVVKDIADNSNFITMLSKYKVAQKPLPKISKAELENIHSQVDAVAIPDSIFDTIATLRSQLNDAGFTFSPRRWKESLQILRANAWFEGRAAVNADDISIYCDVMWNKPDDRKSVCKIVLSVTNPEMIKALEIMDTAQVIYAEAFKQKTTAQGHEASDKLKSLVQELNGLNQSERVKEISAKITSMRRDILEKILDI